MHFGNFSLQNEVSIKNPDVCDKETRHLPSGRGLSRSQTLVIWYFLATQLAQLVLIGLRLRLSASAHRKVQLLKKHKYIKYTKTSRSQTLVFLCNDTATSDRSQQCTQKGTSAKIHKIHKYIKKPDS